VFPFLFLAFFDGLYAVSAATGIIKEDAAALSVRLPSVAYLRGPSRSTHDVCGI